MRGNTFLRVAEDYEPDLRDLPILDMYFEYKTLEERQEASDMRLEALPSTPARRPVKKKTLKMFNRRIPKKYRAKPYSMDLNPRSTNYKRSRLISLLGNGSDYELGYKRFCSYSHRVGSNLLRLMNLLTYKEIIYLELRYPYKELPLQDLSKFGYASIKNNKRNIKKIQKYLSARKSFQEAK